MINYDGIYLTILRIKVHFKDDLGNPEKIGYGTGFVIQDRNKSVIVTNRHMIDYKIIDSEKDYKLSELFIWCRKAGEGALGFSPMPFKVRLENSRIISHKTADVAFIEPRFYRESSGASPFVNPIEKIRSSLADQEFFNKNLRPLDACAFIGYPSMNGADPWWDSELGLPIVRSADIASHPMQPFVNKNVKSSHAYLVTGLSFSGSSGSLILNRGSPVTPVRTDIGLKIIDHMIEPKIIGIMAGHWWENQAQLPEMLRHTGLSYFVSSIAILELLNEFATMPEIQG